MNQESVKGFVAYIKAVSRDSRPQMSSEPGRRITWIFTVVGGECSPRENLWDAPSLRQ